MKYIRKPCPDCGGIRVVGYHVCPTCNGLGQIVTPMTNAERIRVMSDEELAVFLDSIWEISYIAHQKGTGNTLKWLQQPAEDCQDERKENENV